MRNMIIIILFLVIFISGAVVWEIYLDRQFETIVDEIEKIETVEDIENVNEKWEKLSDTAGFIINHNELEEVSQYLWAMKAEIDEDYDEYLESKHVATKMIEHIVTMNSLHFLNIF